MVRSRRLELPRPFGHSDLNAARLPVPPRPHVMKRAGGDGRRHWQGAASSKGPRGAQCRPCGESVPSGQILRRSFTIAARRALRRPPCPARRRRDRRFGAPGAARSRCAPTVQATATIASSAGVRISFGGRAKRRRRASRAMPWSSTDGSRAACETDRIPVSLKRLGFRLAQSDGQLVAARRDIHFGAVEARARARRQRSRRRSDRPAVDHLARAEC